MEETRENKITIGWSIYFVISILIVIIGAIMQKSTIAMLISSTFGVAYCLLIAKEKRIAFILGIINVVIYGLILFKEKMYGGAIYNLAYSLPMLIWGFVKWGKAKGEANNGVRVINKKTRTIASIIILILILLYAFVLYKLGGKNVLLDSVTSILGFVGIYLMSNKYIEQWIVWLISNFANVGIWVILSSQNISNIPMLLMWIVYLINSIYGYVLWERMYKAKILL